MTATSRGTRSESRGRPPQDTIAGGTIRILRYEGTRTGTVRSAWVYMPPPASTRFPDAMVYVLHSSGKSPVEWAFIEAVIDLVGHASEHRGTAPPVVVIPIAAAEPDFDDSPRRSRRGTASGWDARAGDVFSDLMPLVESGLGISARPRQRILAAVATSAIPISGRRFGYRMGAPAGDAGDVHDAGFFAAVDKCNRAQPLDQRSRLIWMSAHESARDQREEPGTVPLARVLSTILTEVPTGRR